MARGKESAHRTLGIELCRVQTHSQVDELRGSHEGSHCLKTWSSTQKSVALSSGEAELIAAVKSSTEVIGILQLAKD